MTDFGRTGRIFCQPQLVGTSDTRDNHRQLVVALEPATGFLLGLDELE
jgi:hypothetical protein